MNDGAFPVETRHGKVERCSDTQNVSSSSPYTYDALTADASLHMQFGALAFLFSYIAPAICMNMEVSKFSYYTGRISAGDNIPILRARF